MKRIPFDTPGALLVHCRQENVDLVVESTDTEKKQRQARIAAADLNAEQIVALFSQEKVMAYYRKDGIFFEIIAKWL